MDKICGVMDAQGFTKDGLFFPRELSIISHTVKFSVIVDTGLTTRSLNVKDRITNRFISNNLLGMSMRSHAKNVRHNLTDDGMQQIVIMYDMVKNSERNYLAIKNDQLGNLLDKLNIPYINLEDFNCPNMDVLKGRYRRRICLFHERQVPDRAKLRCAEDKCHMLWKWVIAYLLNN